MHKLNDLELSILWVLKDAGPSGQHGYGIIKAIELATGELHTPVWLFEGLTHLKELELVEEARRETVFMSNGRPLPRVWWRINPNGVATLREQEPAKLSLSTSPTY